MDFSYLLNQFAFVACFQGFLLALALFFMRKGDRHLNQIFGAYLFSFSWSGVYYTIDFMGISAEYPGIAYTNFLSDYIYNPLMYIYVMRLTTRSFRFRVKSLLHFIPALCMLIYYANYYFAPLDTKTAIMQRGYNYFPWDVAWFSYINLGQALIYLVLSTIVLQRYGRGIKQYYSDIEKRNYNWLKLILLFNLATLIICFFLYRTGWVVFGESITISAGILIYVIGYKMITAPPYLPEMEMQPVDMPVEKIPDTDQTISKYERSGLTEERSKVLVETLGKYMAEQKPWLDPELNLKQLADQLKIPAHHLSQVINQQIGKNFYDYINAFRVEEIKHKLRDPKFDHLTLLAIGLDSGFNSKASFNNVFKKFTGKSPSEYKKEISAIVELPAH